MLRKIFVAALVAFVAAALVTDSSMVALLFTVSLSVLPAVNTVFRAYVPIKAAIVSQCPALYAHVCGRAIDLSVALITGFVGGRLCTSKQN